MKEPKYRSNFEKLVAKALSDLKIPVKYEEDSFEYTLSHKYTPDFKVKSSFYIEAKGRFRNGDQKKLLEIKKQYPSTKILLVFMDHNVPVRKGAKLSHGQWATKHKFEWVSLKDLGDYLHDTTR